MTRYSEVTTESAQGTAAQLAGGRRWRRPSTGAPAAPELTAGLLRIHTAAAGSGPPLPLARPQRPRVVGHAVQLMQARCTHVSGACTGGRAWLSRQPPPAEPARDQPSKLAGRARTPGPAVWQCVGGGEGGLGGGEEPLATELTGRSRASGRGGARIPRDFRLKAPRHACAPHIRMLVSGTP